MPDGSPLRSSLAAVNRGVPQGSILGPILFILYSADITRCIRNCKYHIYADDIQVYISFKPENLDTAIKYLNEDLQRIVTWAESNNLVLNPIKSKYLLIGSRQRLASIPSRSALQPTLLGVPIERVLEARNLGLTMDAELRFEKHVADCVQACFYRLKILYKIRPFLSTELRTQLVEALVLSKLNYADSVYGPRLLARTQRLVQRVQNACARFCYSVPPRSHITPFLNKHYILKMKSRRKLHLACLLFGVVKYEKPVYLHEKLSMVTDNRRCTSRQCSQQLAIQTHRSAAFRGSFRYAATKCWNNIPPPIRNLNNIFAFKMKLKTFLTESQRHHGNHQDVSFI